MLSEIAKKNSAWTWDRIRESGKYDHKLGEESITDFILLNFKKWAGTGLRIKTFTKKQEFVNGADWEWWFIGRSMKWIGMRVQAKIIDLSTYTFNHLYYQKGGESQVEKLVKSAFGKHMLPVYCLYTNWNTLDFKTELSCSIGKFSSKNYGISLVNANFIKFLSNHGKPNHLIDLFNIMIPLNCIFCPKDNTSDISEIIFQSFPIIDPDSKDFSPAFDIGKLLQKEPPSYINDLYKIETPENIYETANPAMMERIDNIFTRIEDNDLKGIAIIEENEKMSTGEIFPDYCSCLFKNTIKRKH